MLGWLARKIEKTRFAQSAVEEQADLSPFKDKPTVRLVIGLILIGLSFILGWPAVGAFGVISVWLKEPLIFLIGGPLTYGFSWLVWAVGMYFTGKESYKYGRIFNRWLVRRFVEKYGSGKTIR